jgi:D-beta-D-heptose 7-phosphate kinase/D-beta-D-heptose 1-phosphate adenosyltransferase
MQYFNEEEFNSISLVGVNSDRSVSQLKGLSRPVETFEKRCEKILETGYVDGVLEIDNISSLSTIKTLMPDVLIKGGSTDQIVGQDFVESYGGKVIKTDLIKGYSTTNILKERNN